MVPPGAVELCCDDVVIGAFRLKLEFGDSEIKKDSFGNWILEGS